MPHLEKQKSEKVPGVSHNVKPPTRQRKYYIAQGHKQLVATINATKKIQKAVAELLLFYRNITNSYRFVVDKIINDLKPFIQTSSDLWNVAENVCLDLYKLSLIFFYQSFLF